MIKSVAIAVDTTGSAGSATGSARTNHAVVGRILALQHNYHASCPNTADVTVTEQDGSTTIQTIHIETNSTADVVRYPRTPVQDAAETDVTYDGSNEIYEPFVTANPIDVAVAGADALTNCVIVTVIYEE
jgi:hypothetical protein